MTAPPWILEALDDYRHAVFAWEALRGSGTLAPSTVPGTAGSEVAMYQLEDADFAEYVPRPQFKDYLVEHAARRRNPAA